MAKIIKVKVNEDITSVIDYLWETEEREVVFWVPVKAVLCQDAVSLKLLKREAEHLGKKIILVTQDEEARVLAEQVGLKTKPYWPKEELAEAELVGEEVLREMPAPKFESLIEEEVRLKRQVLPPSRISDIRPISKRLVKQKKPEFELEGLLVPEPEKAPRPEPAYEQSTVPEPQEEIWPEEPVEYPIRMMPGEQKERIVPAGEFVKEPVLAEEKISLSVAKSWAQRFLFPIFSLNFFILFTGTALIIAVLVLYLVLPKAEIVITPKSERFVQDLIVSADKSVTKVDPTQNKIPAQLIKLDKKESREFSATGQRQLNEKAHGVITVYNEYSSAPQGLVEKTRFVSEDGKVFRTTKSITIPGAKIEEGKIVASTINVEVLADQAGEACNIGPSKFTIPGFQGSPKYQTFYGRSKDAMTGGVAGLVKVVSQEDFDKAKAELWKSLQFSLDQEIRAQIPSGLKLLNEALKEEISEVDSTVEVGGKADKFTLTLKGTATVLIFDEKDIFQLFGKGLENQLGEDKTLAKDGSHIVYREMTALPRGEPAIDFAKGRLNFKTQITEKVVWKISADELKKSIVGKNEQEIKQIFNQHQEIDKARVLFWPFWVKSVPKNLDKIKITIE